MKLVEIISTNHWHVTFCRTHVDENTTDTLLSLTNSEENARRIFGIAKGQFICSDPTDCYLELRDSRSVLVDEHPVTFIQMKNLADLVGFELKEPAPPALRLIK